MMRSFHRSFEGEPEQKTGSTKTAWYLNLKGIAVGFSAFLIFLVLYNCFVIVNAGHRGVVLRWGKVQERIMGEGLNFKMPFAEKVIPVSVKVSPHPFKEIDAASKEYQTVKLTGMMNFHIDPMYVNDLYQRVGLDFAEKVIDPAFNDFVKEVAPEYSITEILPRRDDIRKKAQVKLGENLARYHILVDDIYIANIRFSPEYEKAIEQKQVTQQQVENQKQVLAQREIEAKQRVTVATGEANARVAQAEGNAKAILTEAEGQAKANIKLAESLTPQLIEYKKIIGWNGVLPQVTGGAVPWINVQPSK